MAKLRGGSEVVYVGHGTRYDEGLQPGDKGQVVALGGDACHVLWRTGANTGKLILTARSNIAPASDAPQRPKRRGEAVIAPGVEIQVGVAKYDKQAPVERSPRSGSVATMEPVANSEVSVGAAARQVSTEAGVAAADAVELALQMVAKHLLSNHQASVILEQIAPEYRDQARRMAARQMLRRGLEVV